MVIGSKKVLRNKITVTNMLSLLAENKPPTFVNQSKSYKIYRMDLKMEG